MGHKAWKFLGFYGCNRRLVRIGTTKRAESLGQRGLKKAPGRTQRVLCPACSERHVVDVEWRRPSHGEGQKAVQVRL